MANEHDELGGRKYTACYPGTVTSNADPERLGRVKVCIPGLIEPESGWALPITAGGGGSAQRGLYAPPAQGADVFVWFLMGDVDRPVYAPGHWGMPGGARETPGSAANETDPTKAPLVRALEFSRYKLEVDERPGQERLVLLDKTSGDKVELNGDAGSILIQATATISITARGGINIDAPMLVLNKRAVAPTGAPID